MIDFFLFLSALLAVFKPDIINVLELESIKTITWVVLLIDMAILLYKLKARLELHELKIVENTALFWFICLIPTLMYFQNIAGIVSLMLKTIVLGLMCYYASKKRTSFQKLILSSVLVFIGELAFNLLFIYILPNGSFLEPTKNMSGEWVYTYLLGSKTNFTAFALSGIAIAGLWEIDKKKRTGILSILVTGLCLISMYKAHCTIGIALMILMFVPLLKTSFINIKLKETKKIFVIVLVILVAIVLILLPEINVDDLQKITHARFLIWVEAVKLFINKPVFGYGMQLNHDLIWLYGSWRYSHNEFLEILLYGGLSALIIYIWIIKSGIDYVKKASKEISTNLYIYLVYYTIAQMYEAKFTNLNLFFVIFIHIYYVKMSYKLNWNKQEEL